MAAPRICTIEGCGKPHKGHGYCPMHLRRFRLYGDPHRTRAQPSGTIRQWLEDHKDYQGDECLLWPFGSNSNGRGTAFYEGKQHHAARVMCILAHGEPPFPEAETAHSCGRGHDACVNPNHLRWDTRVGNQRDRLAHGTSNCGHRNGQAKLTPDQVREIHRLMRMGLVAGRVVAERFNVSLTTVYSIKRGVGWQSITRAVA